MTTNEDIMVAVTALRTDVCGHLHRMEDEQKWLRAAYGDLSDKVQVLSESHNGSLRARSQLSDASLEQQAQLAKEIAAREALAAEVKETKTEVTALNVKQDTQLAILFDLKALAKNPYVKLVLTALGTAILTWLSAKGIK